MLIILSIIFIQTFRCLNLSHGSDARSMLDYVVLFADYSTV